MADAGASVDLPLGALSETVVARTTGRFHLLPGAQGAPLLVGFHGYGEAAGAQLRELVQLPGLDGWSRAAVEALHPFYTRKGEVVRSWMTREDREQAIADNVTYVGSVLRRLHEIAPFPFWVACGFSQGAAMAWRAAVGLSAFAPACRAVIALGGDVPPDLDALSELPVGRALLGRGATDEWYTPEKLSADRSRLAARGLEPEVCEFSGGHEWTARFRERASDFLRSLA